MSTLEFLGRFVESIFSKVIIKTLDNNSGESGFESWWELV